MDYLSAKRYIDALSKYGSVLGLDNMYSLLEELDNPQDKINVIHVAGTNGKGSTICYMETILLKAGYSCGKYTSPVVFDYLEKYQINEEYISEEDFAMLVDRIAPCLSSLNERHIYPTIFEVETAMAFLYFAIKKPDIVIIETGMGGDTDATNVCKKVEMSVITSISYDHMAFLGNTISEIATHKAGIIKTGCPVVINGMNEEVRNVIEGIAKEKNSVLNVSSVIAGFVDGSNIGHYKTSNGIVYDNIHSSMCSEYQKENIALAIEAIECLSDNNKYFEKAKDFIYNGILDAKLPGRYEKLSDKPCIYIDGAHNPDAVIKLRKTIENKHPNESITFIMGVLADKDYMEECKEIVSYAKNIITITPNNQRALNGEKLRDTILPYNSNVVYIGDMKEAVKTAISYNTDVIVAFGSLSYLSELKGAVKEVLGCL